LAPQKLDQLTIHEGKIKNWLAEKYMTITQIHRLLKEEFALEIGETTLRRYIHAKFPNPKNCTVPLVAKPGEEAQVDYGYVGLMFDSKSGKMRKAYAFIMTLAYSRYRFVQFVFKQDEQSWVNCHINAFKFFGGVPGRVLLDNLKAGVIKADIYDPTINRTYAELEKFYGFIIDPAKIRKPEHKGKVERSVIMVKQQLVAGRKYANLEEASDKALFWCKEDNAHKVTRTTGKTPAELFALEREILLPLPHGSFDLTEWVQAKVHRDHHVVFRGSFYSVPTAYIGKEVWLRGGMRTMEIYHDHQLIKTHLRLYEKGKWQSDDNDYPEYVRNYLRKTPERCIAEAEKIGEATKEVVSHILQRPSKQKMRKVQAIIRLKEKYGQERLEKACFKSFVYENCEYKAIKSMLEKGIESKVQEETAPVLYQLPNIKGAYLRPASAYIHVMEVCHG
jgi:hypothetical protein